METLLLLHGAIGAAEQLRPFADIMGNDYKTHCINFPGHGGSEFPAEPFSIELFANDVLQFMEREQLDSASIFGYSMGGYVGMYLAKRYSGKIDKLVTLGTKYYWDEAVAEKEIKMLDPEKMEQKVPAFAAMLHGRHQPNDWKHLMKKTAEMIGSLGHDNVLKPEDYPEINIPALLLIGDQDKMSTIEETVAVYRLLRNAGMGVLPGTQHPIEQVDLGLLEFIVKGFLRDGGR